jgi:hypothetical protein
MNTRLTDIEIEPLAAETACPVADTKKDAALHTTVGNPRVEHGVAQGNTPLCRSHYGCNSSVCKGGNCRRQPEKGASASRFHCDEVTPFKLAAELEEKGVAVIKGLTNADDAAHWAERLIGSQMMRQPQGGLFTDVKPDKAFLNRSDAKGRAPLPPHTDGSNENIPPAVIGLYCVEQSAVPEATCVCSMLEFMCTACTSEEQRWMQNKQQQWSHSFEALGRMPVMAPVCTIIGAKPVIRWSTNLLLTGESSPTLDGAGREFVPDEMVAGLVKKLQTFANKPEQTVAVCAETGDLILIENRTRVHFRGALASLDRFFKRFWLA